MLVLILATWTTNTGNAYTSGMAAMKVFNLKDERRPLVTMLCGAAGTIMAMAGMADAMQGFINIISALVPPIMGVVIADYWIIGKGKPENWYPSAVLTGAALLPGHAAVSLRCSSASSVRRWTRSSFPAFCI